MLLFGCGTTDSQLTQQGHPQTYVDGFRDGRHSGKKEEGNAFAQFIRDEERFADDAEYRAGWLAGEIEGKRLQAQANEAGEMIGDAYVAEEEKNETTPMKLPRKY